LKYDQVEAHLEASILGIFINVCLHETNSGNKCAISDQDQRCAAAVYRRCSKLSADPICQAYFVAGTSKIGISNIGMHIWKSSWLLPFWGGLPCLK
jgi:hypothetical protein